MRDETAAEIGRPQTRGVWGRPGRTVSRALLLGLAVVGACRDPAAASAPGEPSAPVRAYFEALEARDCEALEACVGGEAGSLIHEAGCAHAFEEYAEHPMELVQIESVTPDGRDAELHLIRARVRAGTDELLVVIGVRALDGAWRVVRI